MSNRELSLANAIAHGENIGYRLTFRCEQCGNDLFTIIEASERKEQDHQDIIIERHYYLKCTQCGTEEADHVITIIPSWSGVLIDRNRIPERKL